MKCSGHKNRLWFGVEMKDLVSVVMHCLTCDAWFIGSSFKVGTVPYVICDNCSKDAGHDVHMQPAALIRYSKEHGVAVENVPAGTTVDKPEWDK